MPDWSWKVEDRGANEGLHLRYEPGAWGDLLKGVWAVALARVVAADHPGGAVVRLLDPFAGAPTYPRVEATAARLRDLRDGPAVGDPLISDFLARAEALGPTVLPSAASLARLTLEVAGARPALEVFDLDLQRRAAWSATEGAHVLPIGSGEQALDRPADLAFVDPYDFAAAWPALRARLESPAHRDAPVLIYLFNKAPRGAPALREYRALRADLDAALAGRRLLVGRVPSDAVLPRAWHEVLLLAPPVIVEPLVAPLRVATQALARHLSDAGAFDGP